ncbi:phage tail protein [Vibrio sp. 1291-1]|uniref:phage tail-collar fiber domain-containing protein n=1 Tax=Vibrio sp. 1291-1 TaxID=3074551 RepID=UPI00296B513D|nr:phage tail protein [Vibrio sp. 1291-1]MDW3637946.1 phage tail protein [Vibrio sp. 1291-1]
MANSTDKSILTAAGKALLAQLNAEEKPLIIDKMIFANVQNRPEYPQPDDVVPTEHIVHQEQVEQRGRLSADSVIYSSTLTSDVGPFDFNWTGAYCSEYGVLVTIDHHALTPKTADEPGVAGNTLVRSVVLEYKDIAEITNITVDASSWQYNATERMKKMDSDVAQSIIDQNGKDWFIEDGFLVTPSGSAYSIKAGAGYVSGNRVAMEFDRSVQVPNKPSFIYIDAHREGTPTGEQVTLFNFVVTAEERDDYIDSSTGKDVKHFVCKIAQVHADGSVSDLRPEGESVKQLRLTEKRVTDTQNLNPGFISGTVDGIKEVAFSGNEQAIKIIGGLSDSFYHLRDKPEKGEKIESIDLESKVCVTNKKTIALITIPEKYALDLYATQPEEVHVWEYMIGRSFSEAQQMAIDAAEAIVSSSTTFDKASATIVWPRGIFSVDYPGLIYNPDGIRFKGQGKFSTQFVPSTNMIHPNLPQKWKDLPDSYESPSLLIFARRRQTGGQNGDFIPGGVDATPRYISVEDFSFMGRGSGFDKTISLLYGHGMSHVYMKGFYANGFKYVIDSTRNVYRCEIHDYELEHCVGFTNHPGGTTFENHNGGLTNSDEGWTLRKVSYTTWFNVACDHWGKGEYGWDFEDCLQVNLVGCGMEKGFGGAFRFKGERCSVNLIGVNVAAGSNPNQDNYEGQTTPQDFGVEDFSVIEGAVVNIGSGCSIRQEFSQDGTMNNLKNFPVEVKDVLYGENENQVRSANVTVGALGDVHAATFEELFPSTKGKSKIKNLDPETAIEFVGVNDRVQSVGSDEAYRVDFNPVSGRDKHSLWDPSTKIAKLKHGGRVRISFNALVKGTNLNYIAISIAGKDSPLIKLDRDITTQDNVSYSTELNVIAGDEVSIIARTYPNGNATIEPFARLNISYV